MTALTHLTVVLKLTYYTSKIMRKEINVQTGEVKELPDAPVTWTPDSRTETEKEQEQLDGIN